MKGLELPIRMEKERKYGITSIVDFGIPVGELESILNDYHPYIDVAKLGIGTAYVTPNIGKKLELYKNFGIKAYCGGTLFEKFYFQKSLDKYLLYLNKLGFEWLEVSTGILDIPLEERLELVLRLKQNFHVISEVGSKDTTKEMGVDTWVDEMSALLEAGCEYVITEGRDSGTSGIYAGNGQIKTDLVRHVVNHIDYKRIIFEAPTPKGQMYFINQLGPNVNLGNVKIRDVLLLEAQRAGLRTETFFMGENEWSFI